MVLNIGVWNWPESVDESFCKFFRKIYMQRSNKQGQKSGKRVTWRINDLSASSLPKLLLVCFEFCSDEEAHSHICFALGSRWMITGKEKPLKRGAGNSWTEKFCPRIHHTISCFLKQSPCTICSVEFMNCCELVNVIFSFLVLNRSISMTILNLVVSFCTLYMFVCVCVCIVGR